MMENNSDVIHTNISDVDHTMETLMDSNDNISMIDTNNTSTQLETQLNETSIQSTLVPTNCDEAVDAVADGIGVDGVAAEAEGDEHFTFLSSGASSFELYKSSMDSDLVLFDECLQDGKIIRSKRRGSEDLIQSTMDSTVGVTQIIVNDSAIGVGTSVSVTQQLNGNASPTQQRENNNNDSIGDSNSITNKKVKLETNNGSQTQSQIVHTNGPNSVTSQLTTVSTNGQNNNNANANAVSTRGSRVVHVRNIPADTSEADLVTLALPFGRVTNCLVLRGKSQAFVGLNETIGASVEQQINSNNSDVIHTNIIDALTDTSERYSSLTRSQSTPALSNNHDSIIAEIDNTAQDFFVAISDNVILKNELMRKNEEIIKLREELTNTMEENAKLVNKNEIRQSEEIERNSLSKFIENITTNNALIKKHLFNMDKHYESIKKELEITTQQLIKADSDLEITKNEFNKQLAIKDEKIIEIEKNMANKDEENVNLVNKICEFESNLAQKDFQRDKLYTSLLKHINGFKKLRKLFEYYLDNHQCKPGSKNYGNIYPPSATLHLSNIPSSTSEEDIREAFATQTQSTVVAFKFFPKDRKMALIQLSSIEESIQALILMHNYQLSESSHLRVSFSKSSI